MAYLILYLILSLAGYIVLSEWKPEPIYMGIYGAIHAAFWVIFLLLAHFCPEYLIFLRG